MTTFFLILISTVILICVWLNNLSSKIGVPTLLAFILLGILFANNGLIPIDFEDRELAKETCTVALIFIMFYGGFGTRWESARPIAREAVLLASLGVVLTAGLTGLFCHFALGWSWIESMLMGSVISSTDAASVFSILRSKRLGLKNNTAPLLEMESGSNDPCSYMLTVIFLSVANVQSQGMSGWGIVWMTTAQIAFGALGGFGIAKLAGIALDKFRIKGAGFDSLFILAVALASYAIPDLIGGNGYLSAYIVGIILGNREFSNKKALVGFFDGVTGLMQVIIFFMLGLLVRPAMLHKAILPALAIFFFLLIVARPLAVGAILTPVRKYSFSQQCLVSFAGLRGAASIVFAIMATSGDFPMVNDIFGIVFCIVLLSISLQGSLIPFTARKLGMTDAGEDVMKTFNDFADDSQMQFTVVEIGPKSSWKGKTVRELGLPKGLLLALVLRNDMRIAPKGLTVLLEGDRVIIVSRSFEDSSVSFHEKTLLPGNELIGKHLHECRKAGIILLIRRGDKDIIPSGDTLLKEDDRLVIFNGD
ncbi:MAG: potassium/proton antiporter [Candidatus Cryptobacteroides sp.]